MNKPSQIAKGAKVEERIILLITGYIFRTLRLELERRRGLTSEASVRRNSLTVELKGDR